LVNLYGPTEAAIDSVYWACKRGAETIPIGNPVSNMRAYILDSRLQPVPIGIVGELYLAGKGLARGYVRRPDLTAEKFIPDPLSAQPDGRLYKTGDLARYLEDGSIEYIRRVDHQVKLRGFRIELGEIEAVLAAHVQVHEAVVVVREETSGEQRLIAYLTRETDGAIVTSELRAYLREKLPEYMVPSQYVLLEALPLTSNGKINRRALPAPPPIATALEASYIAPRTEVEKTITAIWQDVLQLESVGVSDNFFDLGGHSLFMVKVLSRLRETVNEDLTITDLFRYPSVGTLASYLTEQKNKDSLFDQVRDRARKRKEAMNRRRQFEKARSR